jgi:uncharacterized protein involved in exopolysaccharide biosynthesis
MFEIKQMFRRRRWFLTLPPFFVTILCVIGAYTMAKKYESNTTIWVQSDEILNPLVSYQMAVQLASSDRLETFREIVYSRRTIEAVIDSLGMGKGLTDGIQWDELIERIRRSTTTTRKGSDSFTITYIDTDPVRAQQMVSLLARVFIETRIRGEAKRNETTVQFFEGKLQEYQQKFASTQHEMVSLLVQRMRERPTGSGGLYNTIASLDDRIQRQQVKLKEGQQGLMKLGLFPDAFHTDQGRQALSELRRSNLPYADELRGVLAQYDDVTARYTSIYPEVGKIENQILEILRKMRVAVQADIAAMSGELDEFKTAKTQATNELMQYSVDEKVDTDKKSNYSLYERLYEDMKTKLEQAKITRELGKNAENSFIIIDPARVPAKPSKPNKGLIIGGGIAFGLILGIALSLLAELLDSRVRSPRDLQAYKIPVIAMLPEIGSGRH